MSGPGFQIYSQCKFRTKAMPHLIPEIGRGIERKKNEGGGSGKEDEKK